MTRYLIGLAILACALFPGYTHAYYGDSCSQYGIMAYESGGYCKCMAGYVFGTSVLGDKTCVSADSVCTDKYGYSSRYDSLSESCECRYGYSFQTKYGRTQCVSNTSLCSDQIGIMSTYNTLTDSCECMSGYVIDGGQCTSGSSVCRAKHGLYSSYTSYNNKCSCDEGYTLDDYGQCVEKQNNVYFKLLDVNTDDKQAIIKSDYDSRRWLVTYGTGCLSSTMNRYKNRNIVVNLGTDYDVDTWDTIVLQDDSQTCSITRRERTYEDALETEEEYSYYVPTPVPTYTPPVAVAKPAAAVVVPSKPVFTFIETPINPPKQAASLAKSNVRKCPSAQECAVTRTLPQVSSLVLTAIYSDWYKISKIDGVDAQGWINKSVLTFDTPKSTTSPSSATTTSTNGSTPAGKSFWEKFFGWFGR